MIYCDRSLNDSMEQAFLTTFPLPHSQTDQDQIVKQMTLYCIRNCDVRILIAISIISLIQMDK